MDTLEKPSAATADMIRIPGAEPVDTSTSHVGFRCILRGEGLGDG